MFPTFILRGLTAAGALTLLLCLYPIAVAGQKTDESLLSRAAEQARRKSWSQAEAMTRRYLRTRADSGDGRALLGYILFNQQRWKESMAEYVEAATYRNLSPSELKTFALDCAQLKLFSDADKWLTRSLDMNSQDAKGWEVLGHFKFEEQRYEEAIMAFRRSLALAPRVVSAETGVGLSCELLSRLDEAKRAYKTAISWEAPKPRDPTPYHGLGRVLLKQNKPAEALPLLLQAVQLGPGVAQAHEELGKAYSSLNQLPAAQKEIERAVQLAPTVARLHYKLGQLYRKAGLMDKAKAELDAYAALVGTNSTPDVDAN
jgi:tetratricopeptide (TPR) repeat protein